MPLWYTDRSRYETGLGFCPTARYLEYHFGPSGYGIRLKAHAIPQVRGIFAHAGLASLMAHLAQRDDLPGDHEIREAVRLACEKYERVVDARGLRMLDTGERLETVMAEQQALLTGMIWGFALEVLPWFHAEFRVVSAEQEEIAVLGCTCGLGDLIGSAEDHESRGCDGIAWMSRADVIAERKTAPGAYAYIEFKTTGQVGESWETGWETKIQFSAGVLGAEQRLGIAIDASYVIGLITGRREGSYDYETKQKSGPRIQQSVWCYGYRKPAPAPGMVDDWQASYNYVDEQGRNRRLGKDYQKAPVWEMDSRLTGGLAPAEFWARWVPPEIRRQQFVLIGPLQKQKAVIEGWKQEVVAEERRWQGTVWELYDVQQQGHGWESPEFQTALSQLAPRSWQCRRYGKSHECQFADLCFRREGWQEPLGPGWDGEGGRYMLRRPHHDPEVEQAVARGIVLPEDEGEGED